MSTYKKIPEFKGTKRKCKTCQKVKVINLFEKCAKSHGGYRKKCKQCKARLASMRNSTLNGKYTTLRSKRHARGLGFNLSFSQFLKLHSAPCFYCGSLKKTDTGSNIDRINSTKGYIISNCRSCCYTCNRLKSDFTESEFYKHIHRITSKHPLKS